MLCTSQQLQHGDGANFLRLYLRDLTYTKTAA